MEEYKESTFSQTNQTISRTITYMIYAVLTVIIFFIPLVLSRLTVDSAILKTTYSQILILLLFSLWVLKITFKLDLKFAPNRLNIPILLFAFWNIISILLFSQYKLHSIIQLGKFLSYFMIFFVPSCLSGISHEH